jgi:uncharacterized membrane protein YqjE
VRTEATIDPGSIDPASLAAGSHADGRAAVAPEPPGLADTVNALREELMNAVHERVHLVALELKQVSLNATQMVLLATVAGLMLAGAWATVLVAVYMACIGWGMPWGVALLVVLVLNIVGAGLAWLRAHALSDAFTFPASVRMLKRLGTSQPEKA